VEKGFTFIDTAEGYNTSEKRIGRGLAGFDREDLFIATKVTHDFSAKGVETALHRSLRDLRTDYVDLYQIHWWDETIPVEETLEAMIKYRDQGKIRYLGVSNFRVEHLQRALEAAPIVSNQINYNMFLRTPEKELIPFCRDNGIGILAHSTLGKGLLSGKYGRDHSFSPDDERSDFDQYRGKSFDAYLDTVDRLKKIAERKGWSMVELAIAWVLRLEEVTSALVGIRTPSHVDDPLEAGDAVLTDGDSDEIDDILTKANLEDLAPFKSQIV
jgi:aryl-alcohol dehydrogenase-like predicted oxidoreductase